MPTKTRRAPLTDEQREEKRATDQALVRQSVETLLTSAGWQTWLTTRSRFHRYSFGNQLLIAHQHPTAERVAGFRKWLELGYCVQAGEHGIRIWAPCPPSKKQLAEAAARGDERPRTFFRLAAVFAQDQVAELPPPATPVPLEPPVVHVAGDDLAPTIPALIGLAGDIGSAVTFEQVPGAALGYYAHATKSIVIEETISPNGAVKVLIHELAHALVEADRQDGDPKLDYDSGELVAESVAMSVCGTLGLDTTGYSIPYLAAWTRGAAAKMDEIEAHAKLVNRLACRIEDALETAAVPA